MQENTELYSRVEEWVNSITHYAGVVLGLVGFGALLVKSLYVGNSGYLAGCIIFSLSIILLYSMSGTYHILNYGKAKRIFQILDHSAIYVLISGSYAPYLLGVFKGDLRWILFWTQMILTAAGILFKIFFTGRFEVISTLIYLFMGWMIIFVYKDLKILLPQRSLELLIAGGVSYTVGIIFYSLEKLKFAHAIWHLFVLAGTIFMFFSVYVIF